MFLSDGKPRAGGSALVVLLLSPNLTGELQSYLPSGEAAPEPSSLALGFSPCSHTPRLCFFLDIQVGTRSRETTSFCPGEPGIAAGHLCL